MRSFAMLVAVAMIGQPIPAAGEDLDAPDLDQVKPRQKIYTIEWERFSIWLGGGVLVDYMRDWQDDESAQVMPLHPESGIRDLRGLVSGKLLWSRLRYTLGYAYLAASNEWRFRQTGLDLQLPELGGYLFLGRTKEGFSTSKFTVGYYGWMNERSAANDAFIPILADGARWTGTAFAGKLVYNLGAFADPLSDSEQFNRNDWQLAGRAVWLPLATGTDGHVLHLALQARHAGANDGELVFRSKPEANLAQSNAVDTGAFAASRSTMLGAELYYLRGPLSLGSEYYVNQVSSNPAGDPRFHGGEAFVAYLFTGETHPYVKKAAVFDNVVPDRSFFDGGPGAWELVVRFSHVDLDSEAIAGGRFTRATALVNWYATENLRLEVAYGYGVVDRMSLEGSTHFLQTRFQFQVK
jgi:phosphate-selective porin OprO/OprP